MTGLEVSAAVLALLLIAGSAFLAAAETSLTHMSRARAQTLLDEQRKGADALAGLMENPQRGLNPVLLLLLVCHLGAATIVGAIVVSHFGSGWAAASVAVQVVIIYLIAEAAPKTYALEHSDRAALAVAPAVLVLSGFPPLRFVTRLLIVLANAITPGDARTEGPVVSEEELLAMADQAAEADVIDEGEKAFIESIIDFGDTVTREVMVPRTDMVTVSADDTIAAAVDLVLEHGYSRIPVTGDGIDDVVGVVYARDLMRYLVEGKRDHPITEACHEPHFVPVTKAVADLMREMQAETFHLAITIDEYGGTAGIVTLEDLIEELVGEIVDEFDAETPLVELTDDGGYRVDARMPVDELNALVGVDLPEGDWDTVGGLVYNLAGHVPVDGELVEHEGVSLEATGIEGRRIGQVVIRDLAPVPASAGGDPVADPDGDRNGESDEAGVADPVSEDPVSAETGADKTVAVDRSIEPADTGGGDEAIAPGGRQASAQEEASA